MKLTHSVALYVPSTKFDVEIPYTEFMEITNEVVIEFTKEFGGATVFLVQGSYLADNGEVITEKLNVVEVFSSRDRFPDLVAKAYAVADMLKSKMSQETVSIRVNYELHIV